MKVKKKQVVEIFGSVTELAKAVGVVSQAISRWPDVLQDYHIDAVISAAWREKWKSYLCDLNNIGVKVERRDGDL
jgi:DNA-binding transcriptional regulator Cro